MFLALSQASIATCPLTMPTGVDFQDVNKVRRQPGVASTYMSRIRHLSLLFQNLPETIPLQSGYKTDSFCLDPQAVASEGQYSAFQRAMGAYFGTPQECGTTMIITERGLFLQRCIMIIKTTVKQASEEEREIIRLAWIEPLISAAQVAGAKIPNLTGERKHVIV